AAAVQRRPPRAGGSCRASRRLALRAPRRARPGGPPPRRPRPGVRRFAVRADGEGVRDLRRWSGCRALRAGPRRAGPAAVRRRDVWSVVATLATVAVVVYFVVREGSIEAMGNLS